MTPARRGHLVRAAAAIADAFDKIVVDLDWRELRWKVISSSADGSSRDVQEKALRDALIAVSEASRREPGCINCDLSDSEVSGEETCRPIAVVSLPASPRRG